MMSADEKKASPKKEPASKPAPESKPAEAAPKAEKADAAPRSQGMGEGQKAVTQAYKENWNAIFGNKKKTLTRLRGIGRFDLGIVVNCVQARSAATVF
jgi:hypothetical protein